jgi:hypothetical protein
MDRVIYSFGLSFLVALYFVCVGLHIMYEPKERPSWYGTYYSLADAMEDGWYDRQ